MPGLGPRLTEVPGAALAVKLALQLNIPRRWGKAPSCDSGVLKHSYEAENLSFTEKLDIFTDFAVVKFCVFKDPN